MWLHGATRTALRSQGRGDRGRPSQDTSGVNCGHYELIAGHEYIRKLQIVELMVNPRTADPIEECEIACSRSLDCTAMIVDTNNRHCLQLKVKKLDVVSDYRDQLAAKPDLSFVQKVCLKHPGCGTLYTFERVLQRQLEVQEEKLLADVTQTQCQEACLNQEAFTCRSLNYDYERSECRLNRENRRTAGRQLQLQRSTSTDYFENSCAGRGPGRSADASFVSARSGQLPRESAFSHRDGRLPSDEHRNLPPWDAHTNTRDQFLGGAGQFSGGGRYPVDHGRIPDTRENQAKNPDSDRRYPNGRSRYPYNSAENTHNTGIYSGSRGRGDDGWKRGANGDGNPDTDRGRFSGANGDRYPGTEEDRDRDRDENSYPDRDRDRYPDRDRDRYPARDTERYPGRDRDRYPGGERDRYPDRDRDRYPDRDRDRYPGGDRDRYPGGDRGYNRGPNRMKPPPDVRRCPGRPTFEKVVNMRYDAAGRASMTLSRKERGGTMAALRQCSRDPDCMSVEVDFSGESERFQKLRENPSTDGGELVPDRLCAHFTKVCLSNVEDICSGMWAFDRVANKRLRGHNDIVTDWVGSREECQELCLRNVQLPCRSAEYSAGHFTCVQSRENRRTRPDDLEDSIGTDYMENKCAPVVPGCEFEDTDDKALPYTDHSVTRVTRAECERLCQTERSFRCRSFNYSRRRMECSLSSEDMASLPLSALQSSPGTVFSQQTDCKDVRVECGKQDMVVSLHFNEPFRGRLFVTGDPQNCFSVGDGRSELQLTIPMDSTCGTVQEGRTLFVNHVVVQSHPLITQESDRTIRVECRLEVGDQRISLTPAEPGSDGVNVASGRQVQVEEVIREQGEAPRVALRLLRKSIDGQPVLRAQLGETLFLVILTEQDSAFGLFGKSVEARTSNGERLLLIDERGCPTDPEIFSKLQVDPRTGNLVSNFKAFRFPSTSKVNFIATIGFCYGACNPVQCGKETSLGRRRRRAAGDPSAAGVPEDVTVQLATENGLHRKENTPGSPGDAESESGTADDMVTASTRTEASVMNDTGVTGTGVSRHPESASGGVETRDRHHAALQAGLPRAGPNEAGSAAAVGAAEQHRAAVATPAPRAAAVTPAPRAAAATPAPRAAATPAGGDRDWSRDDADDGSLPAGGDRSSTAEDVAPGSTSPDSPLPSLDSVHDGLLASRSRQLDPAGGEGKTSGRDPAPDSRGRSDRADGTSGDPSSRPDGASRHSSSRPDGASRHPSGRTDGANRHPSSRTDGASRHPSGRTDGASRHPSSRPDGASRHPSSRPDGANRHPSSRTDGAGRRSEGGTDQVGTSPPIKPQLQQSDPTVHPDRKTAIPAANTAPATETDFHRPYDDAGAEDRSGAVTADGGGAKTKDDSTESKDGDDSEAALAKTKLFDVLSQSLPLTATLTVGPDDDELEAVLEERDLRGLEAAVRGQFSSPPHDGTRGGLAEEELEVCAPRLTLALTLVSLLLAQLGLLLGGVWLYRRRRLAWQRPAPRRCPPSRPTDTDSLYSRPYEPSDPPASWRYEDTAEDSCGPAMGADCCLPGEDGPARRAEGTYNGAAQWLRARR